MELLSLLFIALTFSGTMLSAIASIIAANQTSDSEVVQVQRKWAIRIAILSAFVSLAALMCNTILTQRQDRENQQNTKTMLAGISRSVMPLQELEAVVTFEFSAEGFLFKSLKTNATGHYLLPSPFATNNNDVRYAQDVDASYSNKLASKLQRSGSAADWESSPIREFLIDKAEKQVAAWAESLKTNPAAHHRLPSTVNTNHVAVYSLNIAGYYGNEKNRVNLDLPEHGPLVVPLTSTTLHFFVEKGSKRAEALVDCMLAPQTILHINSPARHPYRQYRTIPRQVNLYTGETDERPYQVPDFVAHSREFKSVSVKYLPQKDMLVFSAVIPYPKELWARTATMTSLPDVGSSTLLLQLINYPVEPFKVPSSIKLICNQCDIPCFASKQDTNHMWYETPATEQIMQNAFAPNTLNPPPAVAFDRTTPNP